MTTNLNYENGIFGKYPWRPKRSVVRVLLVGAVIVASIFALGCSAEIPEQQPDNTEVIVPDAKILVQSQPQSESLLAILTGELSVVDGYLWVWNRLVVWPYGYSVKHEGDVISLCNNAGEVMAVVGDTVQIGGGEFPVDFARQAVEGEFPGNVGDKVWMAGDSVTVK